MGLSRQEYWSGLPCYPPGDLPDTEMELEYATALTLQVDSLPLSQNICCVQETDFNYEDSQSMKSKNGEALTSINLLPVKNKKNASFYFTFIYLFILWHFFFLNS